MASKYSHYLEKAMDQRHRAGQIKSNDPAAYAKRRYLIKMAERNEVSAELHQRRSAGHDEAPALRAMKQIEVELRGIEDELDKLGVDVRTRSKKA